MCACLCVYVRMRACVSECVWLNECMSMIVYMGMSVFEPSGLFCQILWGIYLTFLKENIWHSWTHDTTVVWQLFSVLNMNFIGFLPSEFDMADFYILCWHTGIITLVCVSSTLGYGKRGWPQLHVHQGPRASGQGGCILEWNSFSL